jgi:DNA (cytosine-5)-methyltransferase 1
MDKEKLTIVSLFSGAGGMDLGFKQAGFDILFANDFFQEAVNSYHRNVSKNVIYGDITKIKSEDIPDNPDVVIGGFPCQGFSIANNNRSMNDERNFLYKELLRVIRDKKPKFFVAENVKGLLSMEKGKVINLIVKDFEDLGYKVDYKVLNAAEYGIPQMRQRVIIIGNRIGVKNPFPTPTHYIDNPETGKEKCPTVEEVIGELANIPLSEKIILPSGKVISGHIAYTNVNDKFYGRKYEVNQTELCQYLREYRTKAKLSNKQIANALNIKQTKVDHWFRCDNKSGSIPDKEDYLALKKLLQLDDTYDKELTEYEMKEIKFEQSLRITNWSRPSDTITATSPEIHVNKARRLSVRECARLQTFPDDFEFCGTLEKQYRQIGNAVPVQLAKIIAQEIKKTIESVS